MGNILERATIAFPKPLAEKGVKELFHYLVQHIPRCTINYSVEKKGRASINPKTSQSTLEEYASGISVSINSLENEELRMGTFEGLKDPLLEEHSSFRQRYDLFFGIRFFITPGYEEEMSHSELSLMDEVRQKTQEFFESRDYS